MISEQLTNSNINREVAVNVEVKGNLKVISGKLRGWSSDRARVFVKLDRNYGRGMAEGATVEIAVAAARWSDRSYKEK